MIVIKSSNGIWPLALKASGQPPLFWLSTGCVGPIEGPELESYPGIIFYISGLGINLPSTYCGFEECIKHFEHNNPVRAPLELISEHCWELLSIAEHCWIKDL